MALSGELCMSETKSDEAVGNVITHCEFVPDSVSTFATIAKNMIQLTDDGKLLKEILRKGRGTSIAPGTNITICYTGFIEFNSKPFDSTYTTRNPLVYCMFVDTTVIGLDIAIEGMKVGERARLLMTSEYAYGRKGHLNLVPPYSSVLYEVEILNTVGSQPLEMLSISDKCERRFLRANEFFSQARYILAIREYNRVISSFENCVVKDAVERKKQLTSIVCVLTNLVVTHTKSQQSKLACCNANKAMRLCDELSIKVPLQIYVNKARSLIKLGEYCSAERLLKKAKKCMPDCNIIKQELCKLYKSHGESEPSKHKKSKPTLVSKEIKPSKAPIPELTIIRIEPPLNDEETKEMELNLAKFLKDPTELIIKTEVPDD